MLAHRGVKPYVGDVQGAHARQKWRFEMTIGYKGSFSGRPCEVIGEETTKRGKLLVTVRFADGSTIKTAASFIAPDLAVSKPDWSRPIKSADQVIRDRINGGR